MQYRAGARTFWIRLARVRALLPAALKRALLHRVRARLCYLRRLVSVVLDAWVC